jgi:hypothetical protein
MDGEAALAHLFWAERSVGWHSRQSNKTLLSLFNVQTRLMA